MPSFDSHFPCPLISSVDRQAARDLVGSTCLRYEEGFNDLLGIFDAGELIACGARAGRVLKMLVVAGSHRGQGLLGDIVTELMRRGREANIDNFFIFTRPETVPSFTRVGFKPLVSTDHAALLEHGNGLYQYLRHHAELVRSGHNAGVVINADPFTSGHLYLVERACEIADWVYVFVASEGSFVWTLEQRLEQVRLGTEHLARVMVTDTGPYSLGAATFPAYFLKREESVDEVRLEVDAELFAAHLAPAFHLVSRVVGTEPLDPTLRHYNRIVQRTLERHEIRLHEVERQRMGERWISTQMVQKALSNNDIRVVQQCVPESTLDYLLSPESRARVDSAGLQ